MMKKVLITSIAAAAALSFAVPAQAAGQQKVSAAVEKSCKDQAAKKFSAIHFLKRRDFVNKCIDQHAGTKAKPATTTGQGTRQ